MNSSTAEFSFKTRQNNLSRFQTETFDLLVIGGGITGAAVARDASSRGLHVALVERKDFAYGTSSRSSKLIHGGLRYLQNFELGLVFEALSERTHLLKAVPYRVRPLPFYLPVYQGDTHSRALLSLGLWLYDLLALFRAPGFHRQLSRQELLKDIPFLKSDGLTGGFTYFDASMCDDLLVIDTLRSAQQLGACVANYVEAVEPVWTGSQITGFKVRDHAQPNTPLMTLQAKRTVICVGPWTDQLGIKLSPTWGRWLNPSKGVHLIFDLSRIPIPGALVMSHPQDGRVSFVIPRPDLGAGVVIVGTTDGPTDDDPEQAKVNDSDIDYLLALLDRYFPSLKITRSDILSTYVGVRPLMGTSADKTSSTKDQARPGSQSSVLQKVSREHHIDIGPGGTTLVAGGKYTTHRTMAEEIVDFTLHQWKLESQKDASLVPPPPIVGPSQTKTAVHPAATEDSVRAAHQLAAQQNLKIPQPLFERYGADAVSIYQSASQTTHDPVGFPCLEEQLRYSIQHEMTLHLDDFFCRRSSLYAARRDHGAPWAEALASVWAQAFGKTDPERQDELAKLKERLDR